MGARVDYMHDMNGQLGHRPAEAGGTGPGQAGHGWTMTRDD
jgi:hypothetical protein